MKKILVTGQQGLASAIAHAFKPDQVTTVSRSSGHDIHQWQSWIDQFLSYDVFVNNAYCAFSQTEILMHLAESWRHDPDKVIVNIGSMVIDYKRSTGDDADFWPYRLHKQSLDLAFSRLARQCQCRVVMINPGPIDTDMVEHLDVPKMSVADVASYVVQAARDPMVRRLDLWR